MGLIEKVIAVLKVFPWSFWFWIIFNIANLIFIGTRIEKIRENNRKIKKMREDHIMDIISRIDMCDYDWQVDCIERVLYDNGYELKDGALVKTRGAYFKIMFRHIKEGVTEWYEKLREKLKKK